MFEIINLQEINPKRYKDFLNQFKKFNVFVSYEWLQCIEASYNNIRTYVLVEKDSINNIKSVLPFVLKKKYGFVICESMAFGTYGGYFSIDNKIDLALEFLYFFLKKRFNFFEIRIYNYDSEANEYPCKYFACIQAQAAVVN